ncbi:MAG: hypothetical protein KDE19_08730 [Caldilineaceae bacterium]|nr:hypothetical protein [Caldilineaceae bacterium]
MKIKTIPSSWISREGRRLDCGPYMSGALETKIRLEELSARKDSLQSLTKGHNGGIYNGPKFSRTWVDSPEYGVPFVGSSDMLRADLSDLPLLRKKDAESNKLSYLRLAPGMTLISCSGTIGRMVYARPDMDGIWSSQHIMKVVPDPAKIPSGYLYAYLSSKFGVPQVVSGTYGSIIQSIEPHHIADLPVPRLGDAVEQRAHALVEEAARLRTRATHLLAGAIQKVQMHADLTPLTEITSPMPFSITLVSSTLVKERFDAFFHSSYHKQVVEQLQRAGVPLKKVRDIADSIVEPTRFKRIPVDDPAHGVPFFGTSALMWNEPLPSYYLPRRQKGIDEYIVTERAVLVPRSGQLSGIIGTAVLPYGQLVNGAVTEDAIRINCNDERDSGFIYLFLTSSFGIRQLKSRAYGTSIPHLDVKQIGEVLLPDLGEDVQRQIGQMGLDVADMRDKAIHHENEAIRLVEQAIEEAA